MDAENYDSDDEIICTVTVQDGYGGEASSSAGATIINTPPIIGATILEPEPAYSIDNLRCRFRSHDLEGDDISLSYLWEIDEFEQSIAGDEVEGPFLVGTEVDCMITPNDLRVNGISVLQVLHS